MTLRATTTPRPSVAVCKIAAELLTRWHFWRTGGWGLLRAAVSTGQRNTLARPLAWRFNVDALIRNP
jgi:hypothetical protein